MYLYGASGHAKVIIEILEKSGDKINRIFDDNTGIKKLLEYEVQKPVRELDGPLIISIGDNKTRYKVAESTIYEYGNAIDPSAEISRRAKIGTGTVIMRNVAVNCDTIIGKHVILNTSASIDHDCVVGDFAHISPNATLCGNVTVGEGAHIGAAAVVIPGIKVGKWAVVGAGSVVNHDVPDYAVVVGKPARTVKYNHPI